jgi:hypothetical protein
MGMNPMLSSPQPGGPPRPQAAPAPAPVAAPPPPPPRAPSQEGLAAADALTAYLERCRAGAAQRGDPKTSKMVDDSSKRVAQLVHKLQHAELAADLEPRVLVLANALAARDPAANDLTTQLWESVGSNTLLGVRNLLKLNL